MEFMAVSSYGDSTKTSGIVKIIKDMDTSIKGKNVLIVEDIVDTGLTLSYLIRMMQERQPKSVRVCVLLDKEERRKVPVKVDYKGFDIPDKFVLGYGLDYAGKWRNLPSIHIVETNTDSPEVGNSMRGGDI
ncbi:Hypoxanthine phosphoribosyltransferase [bioreactor metagenome]|uniref:hypoxanthine phosphoribosyltransferase n=1 Tax=bioreactor metagenome TaxID=1076179 RepID=A0A645EJ62_9ZZZZ